MSTTIEHTCHAAIFLGAPRDVAQGDCPACISDALHARFPQHAEHVLGIDSEGFAYARDELMSWRITECCGASAKGSMGAIVCRGCYVEIDEAYADAVAYEREGV